jgi:hypothetical protein
MFRLSRSHHHVDSTLLSLRKSVKFPDVVNTLHLKIIKYLIGISFRLSVMCAYVTTPNSQHKTKKHNEDKDKRNTTKKTST